MLTPTFSGFFLDKRLNFDEFLPILADCDKGKDKTPVLDFVEGFKVFDKEQKGIINSAELRHLLCNMGESINTTSQASY